MKNSIFFSLIFLLFFSLSVYSQMPTPTPTQIPNGSNYDPSRIARDDFLRFPRPSGQPPWFYIRDNDDGGGYTPLNSQTYFHGTMNMTADPSGFCQAPCVLTYENKINGIPTSGFGVDFGTYSLVYSGLYSNLATITMISAPQDDDENAGKSCPVVGQPVNVSNGNMWLEQNDYKLRGTGEEIEITRFYNSMTQTSGLFGTGFRTKYDESVVFYGDYLARLNLPDGRAVYLTRQTTNADYLPFTTGFYGFITRNTDGTSTLTFKDGGKHQFSSAGILQWQKDRQGNQTTLNYDVNNQLTGITDAFGRTLTVTSSSGLVQSLSDSLGTAATYTYFNGTSQLKEVAYPDGSKFKFEYDTTSVAGKVFLKTVRNAFDKIIETHEYDSQGRATTSEKEDGVEKYIFDYSTWNNPNPYLPYNPYTLVKHKKNAGDANFIETKYFYDKSQGTNFIWKIEGGCNCGSGAEKTTFEYDDRVRLKSKTDALGHQTNYTYDYQGDVLTMTDVLGTENYTYNQFGEVLTRTDKMGGVTTNTFDAAGNLLTTNDALNNTTTLTYNAHGQPLTLKDALNHTTNLSYNAQGLLSQVKDANNQTTNFAYDARARLTSQTDALNETTNYEYDLNNRLKKVIFPDANFNLYAYDLAGRRTQMTDARNNTTNYGYDNAYRLISTTDALNHSTNFGYDLMSNLTAQTDALGNQTNYEYDDFNRLKKVIYPAASGATRLEESVTYDTVGSVKSKTDTAGRTTNYDYDAANRLIKTTDALNEITQFEYNNRSQMTKVKDALNQEYVFTYDALGRQLSQTRAGVTMSYEYDAVGDRTKRTNYNGKITTYDYDLLNRLKTIKYFGGLSNDVVAQTSTFNYDDLSRLTSAVNEEGTVSFTYDTRGRVKTTTDVFGHLLEYGYDANSNRNQLKLDSSVLTSYAYDAANRLTTLTDEASQNFTFGYDIANRLTNKTMPNGVSTSYDYDGMSRLTRLKNQSISATLTDNQFSYNPASQISSIAELTQTKNYTYDNVDRLTGMMNGTANESYSFDNVGNRTSSSLSSTYNYQPFNKLTNTATAKYSYDANGNLKSKSEGSNFWQYVWDGENRLSTVSNRKQTVRYRYDALGRRTRRYFIRGGGENTKFIYDGMDVVADDNGGVLTKYQNGLGIDDKLKVSTSGTAKYFLQDHLGSTVGLTSQSGAITEATAYDSFGNQTIALSTRYGYTGREYDSFIGLNYYRARWYDAKAGRFVSEDPIGLDGGINGFAYTNNNASNLVDPSGLDGCRKLPNGKCEAVPEIPTSGGEPPRRPPTFISDPPILPKMAPTPTATPFSPPPPSPPSAPPTGSEPSSPCECETAIPRTPDFYSGGIYFPIPQLGNVVRVGGSVTIDRHYQVFLTPGVSVGFPPGLDASLTAGYLLQKCKPNPKQTRDYLTSWGGSITGFSPWAVGGGFGVSSGGAAVLGGFGIPGASLNGGYGFWVY